MIIYLFSSAVLVILIIAGIFIIKLAEISKSDKHKNRWIIGALMIIAILAIPILIVGIVAAFLIYNDLGSFSGGLGQK